MFVTPAFAQAAGSAANGGIVGMLFPLIAVFAIMYFLMIRPQQKKMKAHQAMVAALRRGDVVVTAGGLIGKVARVDEGEIQLEVADGMRVRVIKHTIAEVRSKGEPVEGGQANDR